MTDQKIIKLFVLIVVITIIFNERVYSGKFVNMIENPNLQAQIKGEYGKLDRSESLPLASIQEAWNRSKPKDGVYTVKYNQNEIIKLRIREHMTTTLVFPQWEEIDEIIVGDNSIFSVSKIKPNILIVEPQEFVGADTNIIVIAKGYTYWFYVRSEGYNSRNLPDLGVRIRANPPQYFRNIKKSKDNTIENKKVIKSQLKVDYLQKIEVDLSELNFEYSMSGDREIAPKRVYSDGYRTWLDYGKFIYSKRLPAIYAVVDGVDVPVNSIRKGNKLIVQGIGVFTLKNGGSTTCIYPTRKK